MLDRSVQPAYKNSSSFELIKPESIVLKNGLALTVVRGGEQAVAKIEFLFEAGKWYETHPGVSYFTAHQLPKGTASKNSYQISSQTEQLGVHFDVSPGHDYSSIALFGLTKNIYEVFDLTREIITAPRFPQQELDQMKAIYNQTLKINLEKTSYLASLELRKKLFGNNHPYGRDAELSHVEEIQHDWLSDFHAAHFGSFRVICSGSITETLLRALADCFESLELHTPRSKELTETPVPVLAGFFEKKESVQSSLRLGRRAVSRTHADYPALLLLNHIFGGYFGSRLMKNIREEKGLTYGISSSIAALKHASYLTIGTDVNKENRELALQEIKNEMKKLCDQAISTNELEIARNHFIGSLQADITTAFAHADKIKNLLLFQLPADYYQRLILNITALSSQELMKTAHLYLNPEAYTSVVVG